jgi:hypothetical protein
MSRLLREHAGEEESGEMRTISEMEEKQEGGDIVAYESGVSEHEPDPSNEESRLEDDQPDEEDDLPSYELSEELFEQEMALVKANTEAQQQANLNNLEEFDVPGRFSWNGEGGGSVEECPDGVLLQVNEEFFPKSYIGDYYNTNEQETGTGKPQPIEDGDGEHTSLENTNHAGRQCQLRGDVRVALREINACFESCDKFMGAKPGYLFKTGIKGTGYYEDSFGDQLATMGSSETPECAQLEEYPINDDADERSSGNDDADEPSSGKEDTDGCIAGSKDSESFSSKKKNNDHLRSSHPSEISSMKDNTEALFHQHEEAEAKERSDESDELMSCIEEKLLAINELEEEGNNKITPTVQQSEDCFTQGRDFINPTNKITPTVQQSEDCFTQGRDFINLSNLGNLTNREEIKTIWSI